MAARVVILLATIFPSSRAQPGLGVAEEHLHLGAVVLGGLKSIVW